MTIQVKKLLMPSTLGLMGLWAPAALLAIAPWESSNGDYYRASARGLSRRAWHTHHKSTPSHEDIKSKDDRALFISGTEPNLKAPEYQIDDAFNLDTQRCSESFFPGARLPDFRKPIEVVDVTQETFQGINLTPSLSVVSPWGTPRGCAIMNIQYTSHLFLLKSEVTIKNDKMGMAFWTGIKNTGGTIENALNLHLVYHLVLFEKKNERWITKAGYSWGSEYATARTFIKTLTINFPDQTNLIINHDKGTVSSDVKTMGFAGIWEKSENGSNGIYGLGIESDPYHVKINQKFHKLHQLQDLSLNPTIMNGHKRPVQTFFYEPKDQSNVAQKWG